MYLKELSINGFKSFAKKGELEFSQPVTAIVGPNGSGKSNIAESFRFVLGEQSVKSMRGKKGEDLIWGGSEQVSRGNRASVEMLFDNKARIFSLDFDEVKIERTVHRDGQNEYKINDSNVRLKDVHELLSNANIGPTGHHIISQGEADRVISAAPKERREMIEDALGLKVYQLKKKETERKLQKTEENIAQVESLRRESAPHVKYLKRQVEKAERSLEVQKELKERYAEYLYREDMYVAFNHDRLAKDREEPVSRLAEIKASIATAKAAIDAESEPTEDNASVEAEASLASAMRVRQEAERSLNVLEGQIAFLERRINTPQKSAVSKQTVVSHDKLDKLVVSIEAAAEKALSRGGEQNLSRVLNDLVRQLRSFMQKEKPAVVDNTEGDKLELTALQEKILPVKEELGKAMRSEEEQREALESLRAARVNNLKDNHAAEQQLFKLLNDQRELEHVVRNMDSELAHLERDRSDFKLQLQEAVALLGRSAAQYFEYKVLNEVGETVVKTDIVNEDRAVQRKRALELEKLKIRLEELGGGPTEDLLKEYKEASERDEFLVKEIEDLSQSVGNLEQLTVEMQTKLHEQFVGGLDSITKEFNTFFTLMFGGGSAQLKLVNLKTNDDDEDSDNDNNKEVEQGVELDVTLPNKRVKGLHMLSGGERTLTSIALIFAMSQVNPPPFIILDETDAALDEANSRRYGDMIEALAKKSQLILITHNRETMSRAGVLYGVTMGADGTSKLLSVKFDEAAVAAAR